MTSGSPLVHHNERKSKLVPSFACCFEERVCLVVACWSRECGYVNVVLVCVASKAKLSLSRTRAKEFGLCAKGSVELGVLGKYFKTLICLNLGLKYGLL